MAPERTMRSTYFSNAPQSGKAGGRPARGKVSKILTRHDSKPVSKSCQKGELAERARRRGACSERRLWASMGLSPLGHPAQGLYDLHVALLLRDLLVAVAAEGVGTCRGEGGAAGRGPRSHAP